MTDEKKKRTKRSPEAIYAEKVAWIAKHEWAGARAALRHLEEANIALHKAAEACPLKGGPHDYGAAFKAIETIDGAILAAIPPEAR